MSNDSKAPYFFEVSKVFHRLQYSHSDLLSIVEADIDDVDGERSEIFIYCAEQGAEVFGEPILSFRSRHEPQGFFQREFFRSC